MSFIDGVNVGQIDIDSKTINPFGSDDENFLEFVNVEVAKLLTGIDLTQLFIK